MATAAKITFSVAPAGTEEHLGLSRRGHFVGCTLPKLLASRRNKSNALAGRSPKCNGLRTIQGEPVRRQVRNLTKRSTLCAGGNFLVPGRGRWNASFRAETEDVDRAPAMPSVTCLLPREPVAGFRGSTRSRVRVSRPPGTGRWPRPSCPQATGHWPGCSVC
jgi:hypothetical protein